MNKRVNFEDNIFILMMRIRMIRDIITLDPDPELFLKKILDDICFTDQILRILLGYLEENHHLIEREELLEHHSRVEWQFYQVVQELLVHNGNFSIRKIPSAGEKLAAIRQDSLERRRTAEMLGSTDDSQSENPIVSTIELTELLKAF